MNYVIVSGSHRIGSQSRKVSDYISSRISALYVDSSVEILDVADLNLPLWSQDVWDKSSNWKSIWSPIATKLSAADGFIFVTPEWGGMVPPGLKNFLLLCDNSTLGNKPGLIVSISAGVGGSYPVQELRSSAYKNNRICWLPEHIILRGVANFPDDYDSLIVERVDSSISLLESYSFALKHVRQKNSLDFSKFPYGM